MFSLIKLFDSLVRYLLHLTFLVRYRRSFLQKYSRASSIFPRALLNPLIFKSFAFEAHTSDVFLMHFPLFS